MKKAEKQADHVPRHIGIIMDGNGRWARKRGKPRVAGHRAGARAVRKVTETAAELGVEQLTLFAFSSENWRRPSEEVEALMKLFERFLRKEKKGLIENGIRLKAIGRIYELPPGVRRELERVIKATRRGRRMTLCLAVNYGSRFEIVDACRKVASLVKAGRLSPEDIDEGTVSSHLYQPDMPPLDLVIRTGGEKRLSNFLLWQAAYAELWMTRVCWPEFGKEELLAAIAAFTRRERRFGGLNESEESRPRRRRICP